MQNEILLTIVESSAIRYSHCTKAILGMKRAKNTCRPIL